MDANQPGFRRAIALFSLTTGLSAFLAFSVQPLMGKATLPWFGGGPGVWTTAMLFFQLLLLAGYGYAHGLSARLPLRAQVMVHAALVLGAMLCLPIRVAPEWKALIGHQPVRELLAVLAKTVGAPFFALSTTAPLLQRWFGVLYPTRSPYALYALSNTGSLLALLSYPVLVEPTLDISAQGTVWSIAFAGFVIGALACAWMMRSERVAQVAVSTTASTTTRSTGHTRVMWLVLSLIPSWMLLAITNQLCIDVASVPFLWVLPLAIYLLSFIVCFGTTRVYQRTLFIVLWMAATLSLCAHLMDPTQGQLTQQLVMHTALLIGCTMLCHGELARLRPAVDELTLFYLMVSIGGALGGVFVALIAPRLFSDYYELQWGVIACYVALLTRFIADRRAPGARMPLLVAALGLGATVPGLAAAAALTFGTDPTSGHTIDQRRNFYGVLRVSEVPGGRILTHGHIWHGIQRTDPARRNEPTLYYGAHTGIGHVFARAPQGPRRIGVVGLGIGVLARYGRNGDVMRFYEIDPNVIAIAREHFTFLSDSQAKVDVVEGDGRLSLEREAPQGFDVLIMDAFSSDAVPMHLLTREALVTYRKHVKPAGVLAVHVSNRYVNLVPVVLGIADTLGLAHRVVRTEAQYELLISPSTWVLLSADAANLPPGEIDRGPRQLWTDARSSLLEALR